MKKLTTLLGVSLLSLMATGQTANYLNFDGVDDYVTLPNESDYAFTTDFTVEFRIRSNNFDLLDGLVTKGDWTWRVHAENTGQIRFSANGAFPELFSTTLADDGEWHHIAASYDGITAKLYIDGVLEASAAGTGSVNLDPQPVMLGNNANYSNRYFGGDMDEVRIWNVARTASEIVSNMNGELAGTEPGLVTYFNFNQGMSAADNTGITALTDYGSLGNDGVFSNFALNTGVSNFLAGTSVVSQIADQSISTVDFAAPCYVDSTIELTTSEVGVNYYLRDNSDNSIISGPFAGTGAALELSTGLISSTTTFNVYTEANQVMHFDGTDTYLVGSGIDISNSSFTYELWAKCDGTDGIWRYFATQGTEVADNGLHIRLQGGGAILMAFYGDDLTSPNQATSFDGQWHHYAFTFDATTNERIIYVDGVSVANDIATGDYAGTGDFNIGINNVLTGYLPDNWLGDMDEIRVWNVAKTPAEINADMNNCLVGNEAGLLAYYTFAGSNDGIGSSVVADVAGGDNTATLVNMDVNTAWKLSAEPQLSCIDRTYQLTTTPTITINAIADQSVTATDTELCPTNTGTTVTTASSEVGVEYYLRDDATDAIVDGPITGTGSGLTFNTGSLASTSTFNVYGQKPYNNALNFDGTNDYVECGSNVDVSNQSFTIELWAKNEGPTVFYRNLVSLGNEALNEGIHTRIHTDGSVFWGFFGNDFQSAPQASSTDGQWHHYAFTYDVNTNVRTIYVDGISIASNVSSADFIGVGPLRIGRYLNQNIDYWIGDMDEVRVWNVTKSSVEINATMNEELTGSELGLLAYYNFNQGIIGGNNSIYSTVADVTGNGNDGTLTNFALTGLTSNYVESNTFSGCGVEMSTMGTVTVQDNLAPVADVATLSDVTATCEVTSLSAPTATDNCATVVTVTNDATLPITAQGTTVVTWTYDDGNGNTSTQTQNIVITDVTAPVADLATLSDVTATCEVTTLTEPTATDDCSSVVTVTNDATLPITAQGTTVVTWTYDDGNGNTSTQTQNIVITDVTAPVADLATLSDVTATCEVTTLTEPTATDDCSSVVTVTNDATLPITAQGTTVVTWTYDDGNGNTSTQTQNVIITGIDATTNVSGATISANNTTASSYQWVDCDNGNAPISGATSSSFTPSIGGNYAVIITDGNCSETSNCVAFSAAGLNEMVDLGVTIYPNPNNGEFIVSSNKNNLVISIYAVNGTEIVKNLPITAANQTVNLFNVESGVYFVKVTDGVNFNTIRLIVE